MIITELQSLLDGVQLVGAMPKMTVCMADGKCKRQTYSLWAHAHCRLGTRGRGRICFSRKGIERPWPEILHTLAHEVAHFRFPTAAHRSQRFKDATEQYFQQFLGAPKA